MKFVPKALLLTLVLIVLSSLAFCQDYPEETDAASSAQNSFQEGEVNGNNDAKGSFGYGLGGFGCGPFGIIAAAMSNPQPDPQKVILLEQAMGADYVSGYNSSFKKESRKKNLKIAITGCCVGAAVAVVVGSTFIPTLAFFTLYGLSDD
jgi:hypothetical protein